MALRVTEANISGTLAMWGRKILNDFLHVSARPVVSITLSNVTFADTDITRSFFEARKKDPDTKMFLVRVLMECPAGRANRSTGQFANNLRTWLKYFESGYVTGSYRIYRGTDYHDQQNPVALGEINERCTISIK